MYFKNKLKRMNVKNKFKIKLTKMKQSKNKFGEN